MNFKEKIRSMSAKEIVQAMINSLIPPPVINIRMASFGTYDSEVIRKPIKILGITLRKQKEKKICYGCAATNTICKISNKVFTPDVISFREERAAFLETDPFFLGIFESAIDSLRTGDTYGYNVHAKKGNFATIPEEILQEFEDSLPCLKDYYTKEDLEDYQKLADRL